MTNPLRRGHMTAACLIALLIAASLVTIAPQPAHAASANTKACKAYKKLLSKTTMKWGTGRAVSTKQLQFACQDINKDGVKDLVVFNPDAINWEGYYRIYTYKKGKAKLVGAFSDLRVCRNKNFFRDSWYRTGAGAAYSYYRLGKDGKVKELASYATQDMYEPDAKIAKVKRNSDGVPTYYYACKVNGKSVSYSKCMAKIKSLKKGSKDTLKYHVNTAKNRAKYLK